MEKLLPSSSNLANYRVLDEGRLNVFGKLKKLDKLDNIEFAAEIPKEKLKLVWNEVHRPNISMGLGQEILGGKLLDYKFQYLGRFEYGKEEIISKNWTSKKNESKYEHFDTVMGDRQVHHTELAGDGRCNCSWLIDFLMNAEKIDSDPMRMEKLRWRKTYDGFRLTLSLMSSDGNQAEAQEFIFSSDFKFMRWEHHVALR